MTTEKNDNEESVSKDNENEAIKDGGTKSPDQPPKEAKKGRKSARKSADSAKRKRAKRSSAGTSRQNSTSGSEDRGAHSKTEAENQNGGRDRNGNEPEQNNTNDGQGMPSSAKKQEPNSASSNTVHGEYIRLINEGENELIKDTTSWAEEYHLDLASMETEVDSILQGTPRLDMDLTTEEQQALDQSQKDISSLDFDDLIQLIRSPVKTDQ